MEAYSLDLRKRVLAACDAGQSTKKVAEQFDVSPAWVRRLKQRRREDGSIEPRPIPARSPSWIRPLAIGCWSGCVVSPMRR